MLLSRIFKVGLLVLCLLSMSACSTKMAYGFMDFIFKWYVGRYVSLESEQKDLIEETAASFKEWHRHTQLPAYAKYLDGAIKCIESGDISGDWIHNETDILQDMLDDSVNFLKPAIVDLMHSFSDEQAEELLAKLEKHQTKYYKKHIDITAEKRRKRRREELTDSIGRFFGSFTDEQENWIEHWLDNLAAYEHMTLDQQKIWREKVAAALEVRHDKTLLAKHLDNIIVYRTDDWQEELQAALDHNQSISYALIAKLINNQTPKQRSRMIKKLRGYQEDFLELAQDS